jgi:hypothetical protein
MEWSSGASRMVDALVARYGLDEDGERELEEWCEQRARRRGEDRVTPDAVRDVRESEEGAA